MRTINVKDDTYRELIKAKATLTLQEERNISMDELITRMLEEFPKIDIIWENQGEEQTTRNQPS